MPPAKTIDPGSTEQIAHSIVPYFPDDNKKSKYLSYRVSGFSVMEAAQLAGCHLKSVRRWRLADEQFSKIDLEGVNELRKQLSSEYLDLEFTRNFRLVLQKDFEVLYKSVRNIDLNEQEHSYLLKLRSHYTPQHLAMIKQILSGGNIQEPFDFTKLTLTIRREREEITIKTEEA